MMPTSGDLDAVDMIALQNGEDQALDRLMTRWQGPLRAFLFRHTQNEFEALDLAQEAFVRIYQHRQRFRAGAKFSTWLFSIACNLARDRARRLAVRKHDPLDSAHELPGDGSPSLSLEEVERIEAVRAAIASLPEDLRAPLLLAEFEEQSQADIASALGCTAKAVESRLYRARQMLRKALGRWLATQT